MKTKKEKLSRDLDRLRGYAERNPDERAKTLLRIDKLSAELACVEKVSATREDGKKKLLASGEVTSGNACKFIACAPARTCLEEAIGRMDESWRSALPSATEVVKDIERRLHERGFYPQPMNVAASSLFVASPATSKKEIVDVFPYSISAWTINQTLRRAGILLLNEEGRTSQSQVQFARAKLRFLDELRQAKGSGGK